MADDTGPIRLFWKVENPHNPTDFDYHEWLTLGERWRRDRLGRRNGTTTEWILFFCNNPDCHGLVLLRVDDLTEAIDHIVPKPVPETAP